jgi:hypothetical protein
MTVTDLRPKSATCQSRTSLPSEVDEHPSEVVGVLLDAVVERLDFLLIEKPQNSLLELTASLPRDDLDQRGFLRHGLSMMARSARSMSSPRLSTSCRSSLSFIRRFPSPWTL